jgi:hypothetical protein
MNCINGNECDMRTLIKPMRVVDMSGRVIETRQVPETRCRNCYRLV